MIPCSFTTLWEHYDRWWASDIDAFDAGSSLNHGWNPPALLLSQTIAGISPETPGWSTYHVLPKEAFLNSIKCAVPSVKGNVTVALHKSASEYSLELTSPADARAIVGIPEKVIYSSAHHPGKWHGGVERELSRRGNGDHLEWRRCRLCEVQCGAWHAGVSSASAGYPLHLAEAAAITSLA